MSYRQWHKTKDTDVFSYFSFAVFLRSIYICSTEDVRATHSPASLSTRIITCVILVFNSGACFLVKPFFLPVDLQHIFNHCPCRSFNPERHASTGHTLTITGDHIRRTCHTHKNLYIYLSLIPIRSYLLCSPPHERERSTVVHWYCI